VEYVPRWHPQTRLEHQRNPETECDQTEYELNDSTGQPRAPGGNEQLSFHEQSNDRG
jgi:hypothetical protein